jgi:hypothetical protein
MKANCIFNVEISILSLLIGLASEVTIEITQNANKKEKKKKGKKEKKSFSHSYQRKSM